MESSLSTAPGARIPGAAPSGSLRRTRIVGYLCGIGAGALWGTTGPLSTALYARGAEITGIGFWRVLLGLAGFLVYGLYRRDLFRVDLRGWLLVGLVGGFFVALFEIAYQFAIAGAGVAGAAALLYTAPVIVAVLALPVLGEALTPLRLLLALGVMAGATLTVAGGQVGGFKASGGTNLAMGVSGGLLAAASYAGTTLLARYAVPRYGAVKVLFLEIVGGVVILGVFLPLAGRPPRPPATSGEWLYIGILALGTVLAANFLFFASLKRIEAARTAVAATIEPVVGALLALALFDQRLAPFGWLGLTLVVASVASSYVFESADAAPSSTRRAPEV